MSTIKEIKALGFPWETQDPFLFCAYHADQYPKGNENMGPDDSLSGRSLGNDFEVQNGYRMYHGTKVPGFPVHPHRGFETVSIVEEGLVDHSDSLGAAGRFGNGDVQWMTAGKGVQHSEMFPLLNTESKNPLEMFQIWLNLPAKSKMVEAHFAMLWQESIPVIYSTDKQQHSTRIKLIAGKLNEHQAPKPAPDSWAADPANGVQIHLLEMEPNASYSIHASDADFSRTLYFYKGSNLQIEGQDIPSSHLVKLNAGKQCTLENGNETGYILFLEGKPIGEPVVQYGPFVMNYEEQIRQTMFDFQRTQFGGWPWPTQDHVHPRERGRFALHADGREEIK